MLMDDQQRFIDASRAMKAGRIDEAIRKFETCVARRPDDLKALLHLGICHLLNRSEKLFLQIYEEAKALNARLRVIPEEVSRVFAQYEGLVKRVTATALVLGTVSAVATGCTTSHKYSGGVDAGRPVDTETDSVAGDAGADTADTAASAHRYSGGVAFGTDNET